MNTTYVERNNSSDEVCRRANELIQHETHDGKTLMQVESFVTCYKNSRMERLSRICQMSSNHPVRHITFAPPPREHKNLLLLWNTPNRRVGIPRFELVAEALNDMWTNMASIPPYMGSSFYREGNEQEHMTIQSEITFSRPCFLFEVFKN